MKSAEEILLKKAKSNKVFLTSNEFHTIINAMEEYASQSLAELKAENEELKRQLNKPTKKTINQISEDWSM